MTNEELIAENARIEDQLDKLRQRLSTRENLRERIAQLNTRLAIAELGPREAIQKRNDYIEDLVTEVDAFSKKVEILAAENAHLREALALADPVTERYRKSWDITSRALGRARQVLRGGVGYEDVNEDAGWGS